MTWLNWEGRILMSELIIYPLDSIYPLASPDSNILLHFSEVEAFIKANSVELSAEKWLCPLSGKKFKGPEFIRKHLQSKHQDKLDEAKQDVSEGREEWKILEE